MSNIFGIEELEAIKEELTRLERYLCPGCEMPKMICDEIGDCGGPVLDKRAPHVCRTCRGDCNISDRVCPGCGGSGWIA